MTNSSDRKANGFDARQHRTKLPKISALSDLRESGTLEEMLLFRRDNAAALAAEKASRRGLVRNDARERAKRSASDPEATVTPEQGQIEAEKAAPVSSSMLVSMLFQHQVPAPRPPVKQKPALLPKKPAPKAKKPYVSRAAGGPSLKSDLLKRYRTRTWFHALLASADPDVALHYEAMHQDELDVKRLKRGLAAHLVANYVPVEPRISLPSALLEDCYARANEGVSDLTPLNLYARDYLNGVNQPTKHTIELFDAVFPGSGVVYTSGPHGLPVWEVLDGSEQALQSFLLSSFPKGLPTPDAWAQSILDMVVEPDYRFTLTAFLDANDFYRFNIALREAVSKSIKLRYAQMGRAKFMQESVIYPRAVFLLVAAQLSFGANKLLSTRSLQWLIQAFSQMGFYRKFFGAFVDHYVEEAFLKGGPVNKV